MKKITLFGLLLYCSVASLFANPDATTAVTQEGPIALEINWPDVRVTKIVNGSQTCLFSARNDQDGLTAQVQTPFVQCAKLNDRWHLMLDDGRNVIDANIMSTGDITFNTSNGADTLNITSYNQVVFSGNLAFSNIVLSVAKV